MNVDGIHGVGSWRRVIAAEEQAGADCVGKRRDESRPALEARQSVLFDGERMELGTESMRLLLPFVDG